MFQYEPFAQNWRIRIADFFFLIDVGFCLHFSKIVLLQQKCCEEFFWVFFVIIIIKFELWDYHDLRMGQVLGISSSTFRYFSKIKKEAFLWVFSSQITLQFFFFFLWFAIGLIIVFTDSFTSGGGGVLGFALKNDPQSCGFGFGLL